MSVLSLLMWVQLTATPALSAAPADAGVSAASPSPIAPATKGASLAPDAGAAPVTTPKAATAPPANDPAATAPAKAPDDDDEPEASPEVSAESEELEEVKALEEKALSTQQRPATRVNRALTRLGVGSPLRAQMQDAFERSILRNNEKYELGLVTNLAEFDVSRIRDRYDIPVEMQPLVAQYIEFFQNAGRKWFRKWMSRSRRYIPMVQPILLKEGVPQDLVYLAMIESGFSTQAYSHAKAAGMWQFISSTGKRFGLHQDFWIDERRDYEKSTVAAAHYLRELHDQLGHWYLAWAGYNAGGGKVSRAIAKVGSHDFWQLSTGRNLAKETQHYVPKLIAAALVAKHPQSFGFQENEFEPLKPLEHEEVQLADPVDLEVIARAAHCTQEELHELNPELKRWCTPPASEKHPYTLRLPKGTLAAFNENFPKIAPKERLTFVVHHIQKGDTLSQIARRYHSAPEPILQLNHLTSPKRLKLGSELVIPVPRNQADASAALEKQVESARKHGFVATRPEDEVPAGTPRTSTSTPGEMKSEQVEGKTRVTYTVQDGDNLWNIGQRFNVTVDQLRSWNGFSRKSRLQIGAKVIAYPPAGTRVDAITPPPSTQPGTAKLATMPTSAPTPPVVPRDAKIADAKPVMPEPGPRPKSYQLQPGDTLWSVSQKYGVTVDELKRWNHIKSAHGVQAGQKLSLVKP